MQTTFRAAVYLLGHPSSGGLGTTNRASVQPSLGHPSSGAWEANPNTLGPSTGKILPCHDSAYAPSCAVLIRENPVPSVVKKIPGLCISVLTYFDLF